MRRNWETLLSIADLEYSQGMFDPISPDFVPGYFSHVASLIWAAFDDFASFLFCEFLHDFRKVKQLLKSFGPLRGVADVGYRIADSVKYGSYTEYFLLEMFIFFLSPFKGRWLKVENGR